MQRTIHSQRYLNAGFGRDIGLSQGKSWCVLLRKLGPKWTVSRGGSRCSAHRVWHMAPCAETRSMLRFSKCQPAHWGVRDPDRIQFRRPFLIGRGGVGGGGGGDRAGNQPGVVRLIGLTSPWRRLWKTEQGTCDALDARLLLDSALGCPGPTSEMWQFSEPAMASRRDPGEGSSNTPATQ